MSAKIFGTDGVRGRVNQGALTPAALTRLAQATATHLMAGSSGRKTALIGHDTRRSGDMVEAALIAGLTSAGMDVRTIGVLPTPATALLTMLEGADLGIMITASHNKFEDNGVKLFGGDGCKLSAYDEAAIEAIAGDAADIARVDAAGMGAVSVVEGAQARYVNHLTHSLPSDFSLSGLKIVLDCANGAACSAAPPVFKALGADHVTLIGNVPDGININAACGSTETSALSAAVLANKADIGLALDGDADRLIMCDETGRIIDGDQLLALMAIAGARNGTLKGGGLVATVMSNLGLERHLKSNGLTLARTDVGDKYVAAHMRAHGFNIGGEQSGHLLLTDHGTTGDGTLAGLHILAEIIAQRRPASETLSVFSPVPQLLKNVRFEGPSPLTKQSVQDAIKAADERMGEGGRILVRASGTEPLIRVMAEGDDAAMVEGVVDGLIAVIGGRFNLY